MNEEINKNGCKKGFPPKLQVPGKIVANGIIYLKFFSNTAGEGRRNLPIKLMVIACTIIELNNNDNKWHQKNHRFIKQNLI